MFTHRTELVNMIRIVCLLGVPELFPGPYPPDMQFPLPGHYAFCKRLSNTVVLSK